MIIIPFLMAAPSACTLATVNINDWISLDMLILLATFSIGAVIYAISNLLPNPFRDKLKRIVRIEYTEGAFSLVLIASLISIAYAGCGVGLSLSGLPASNYQGVFQSDQYYIGQLLFVKGGNLAAQFMAKDFALSIGAAFSNNVFYSLSKVISPTPFALSKNIMVNETGRLQVVFDTYEDTYTLYSGFVVVTFGALFILYFLLPIIMALGMNLIIPAAIILRSISFAGPKLREASNAFIAIGIALYFVLPLAISANQAIVNWLYCQNGVTACNPYVSYTGAYQLSSVAAADFLTPNTLSFGTVGGLSVSLPTNLFLGVGSTSAGGFWSYAINTIFSFLTLPQQLNDSTAEVAQYLFEGIVLIAIDFAITMGFAQGLYKGLNSIPNILGGGGPFWSD